MRFKTYKRLHGLGLIANEDQLKEAPRPDRLCGKAIPESLNGLTMGQLVEILQVKDGNPYTIIEIVIRDKAEGKEPTNGIQAKDLDKADAVAVVGLVNFIQSELNRITAMFKQLKPHYTKEERDAGIEDLDFGIFGTIDWYAKRMGIINHDDVLLVPWIHIYQCSFIDKENHEFQQRYLKALSSQNN